MKADELWEKYANNGNGWSDLMCKADFHAAIKEYGALVRQRDAEIATESTQHTAHQSKDAYRYAGYVSSEISKEPLP